MLSNLGRGELASCDSINQPSRQVSDPFSSKQHIVLSQSAMLEVLSQALLEEIFNRLEYASFIASASCVCKSFKEAGDRVRSLRLICLNEYHVTAREGGELHDTKGVSSSTSTAAVPSACSGDEEWSSSGDESNVVVFRDVVVDFLKNKPYLLQLRIEIESKLQSKSVPVPERRRTDFWLSDPFHLTRWVPSVQATLLQLCIVDYGQQAIMRRTSILKILSQNCKVLQTLDLRNMFIDSSELEDMPKLTNFILRCVKVIGDALNHINARMRNLSTLALLGVFGVTHAHLDFPAMKVLCLGLSTIAKGVSLELPSLVKLQLKIMCPEKLTITTRSLKYMAFNLEVRDTCKVELRNLHNLEEVLYGASSFATFWSLVASNANLKKVFLDIPCMALAEDGRFLGVLKDIQLNLPISTNLLWCERLGVVNIGPGLFHTMGVNLEQLSAVVIMCPEKLTISATRLKYVAFNLEVMDTCKVNLLNNLEEVLYGVSSFKTLESIVATNAKCLKKVFLDIPCMALAEDGRFLGVLKDIQLNLPISTNLLWCERLGVVNIGPGLFHTMGVDLEQLSAVVIMCPEKLTISATRLKYVAFNLEVMDTCKVNLLNNLEEVLYGVSSFKTLESIVATNAKCLKKVFLDIPCMALAEDGRFLGVLKDIQLNLPISTNLLWCEILEVVNIGPGLWHIMGVNLEQLSAVKSWLPFHRLILHMIPQNLDTCLQILLKSNLYVWRCMFTPRVRYETIVRKFVSYWGRGIVFKSFRWPKSLNFSCFSFSWADTFTGTTAEDRPVLLCGEKDATAPVPAISCWYPPG